jgi:hypothetical protein
LEDLMRHSLFLSSLFAATLVSGAALADNLHPIEFGRAHGDTFEKTYRISAAHESLRGPAEREASNTHSPIQQKQNERVNCSQDSADCASSHGNTAKGGGSSPAASTGAAGKSAPNAIVGKGNDRVSCNEAGEGCEMSSKAAKAGFGKGNGASPTDATPMAQAAMAAADRKLNQAYSERTSCNEGDECSFSSKAAKEIWRTEAFKHGTAQGKGLDFSNAHAALKARMEAARYHSNQDRSKK